MAIINYTGSFQLQFKNEHTVYENEVHCTVKESEFNLSYNPTLISGSQPHIQLGSDGLYYLTGSLNGTLKYFATGSTLPSGSHFTPYATAIGLYNDDNDLLAVAKFGKPILISPYTDMTFVVRYDI